MPRELILFERFQYTALALWVVGSVIHSASSLIEILAIGEEGSAVALFFSILNIVLIILATILIWFLLVYFTARKRNNVCRWILLILFVLSLPSTLLDVFLPEASVREVLYLVSVFPEALSFFFVFTGPGAAFFKTQKQPH